MLGLLLLWGEPAQALGPDPHQQHQVAPGYSRTVVTYGTPQVPVVNSKGQEALFSQALSHEGPTMLQFIFTTCTTICPAMSSTFVATQEKLGDRLSSVRMISVTIDPEHDTPERLLAYRQRLGAGPQWSFYTGQAENIRAILNTFETFTVNKMWHRPITLLRAGPEDPWVRLEGLLSAEGLLEELGQLVEP